MPHNKRTSEKSSSQSFAFYTCNCGREFNYLTSAGNDRVLKTRKRLICHHISKCSGISHQEAWNRFNTNPLSRNLGNIQKNNDVGSYVRDHKIMIETRRKEMDEKMSKKGFVPMSS